MEISWPCVRKACILHTTIHDSMRTTAHCAVHTQPAESYRIRLSDVKWTIEVVLMTPMTSGRGRGLLLDECSFMSTWFIAIAVLWTLAMKVKCVLLMTLRVTIDRVIRKFSIKYFCRVDVDPDRCQSTPHNNMHLQFTLEALPFLTFCALKNSISACVSNNQSSPKLDS